eukprot:scaffold264052_cov30-Tisochrysis_lutea.AAC.3
MGHTLNRHVATENNVKSHLTSGGVHRWLQPDVINVCVRKIVAAAGDTYVELARQIAPHRIAARLRHGIERDEIAQRVAVRARVNHLERVDACERGSNHVAYVVERRLEGCLVAGVQPVDHVWCILEGDAAELDILASGDIHDAKVGAVRLNPIRVEAHLI